MKKKLFLLSLVIIISIACVLGALVSCEKEIDKLAEVNKQISYIERERLCYESELFNVTVVRGEREKNFVADGKPVDVAAFTSISLDPIAAEIIGKSISYRLIGDAGEATGALSKSILGVTYTANIGDDVNLGGIVKAEITIDEETTEITFNNELEGKISAEKAIEYAYNELEQSLADAFDKDGFTREVYVRYINDVHDRQSPYYWYVSFMKDNTDYKSVLINPENGSPIK